MAELEIWAQWAAVAALVLGVLVVFLMARPVSGAEARRLLQAGAKVIDVRSREEFASGGVKGAVNLPLGELAERIQAVAPDKATPLLVHCLSGGRSALAKSTLRRLGYREVRNLGSLGRAKRIVGDSQGGKE
jgi:rhodanese-related sulfurtransferase